MSYETVMKYLEKKGIRKPFQTKKRINLKIEELIEMLEDYEKFKEDLVQTKRSK